MNDVPGNTAVLRMKQLFDASPAETFQAWLDTAEVGRWMGPHGVRAEALVLEPRVGGTYRIRMHTPDQSNPEVGGVYREIDAPRRLVFTWAWSHDPQETLVTLTFRAVGAKTEMTMLHENFANATRRESHQQGWTGSFEKLAALFAQRA